jgi:hypothetical protein
LLTVDEYHRMGDASILTKDDCVELIEGELVQMAPIGSEHIAATNALNRLPVPDRIKTRNAKRACFWRESATSNQERRIALL